jgi:hypothetical protein
MEPGLIAVESAAAYNGILDRVHSDVTQDPVEALEESWKNTVDPKRGLSPHRMSTPLRFQRTGRSHGTLNTKQTIGTKSTMSSQTNEFASVFRKDEQQYWQDVVQEQDESQDPAAGSVGISNRHKKLVKARERVRRREWVGFSEVPLEPSTHCFNHRFPLRDTRRMPNVMERARLYKLFCLFWSKLPKQCG